MRSSHSKKQATQEYIYSMLPFLCHKKKDIKDDVGFHVIRQLPGSYNAPMRVAVSWGGQGLGEKGLTWNCTTFCAV